jgi:hypothetical protein
MKIFKYWKYIIGVIILLFVVIFFIKKEEWKNKVKNLLEVGTYKERTFNLVEFETTNSVVNKTHLTYIDSIVYLGLNYLKIDSVYISVRPISNEVKTSFDPYMTLKAHIIGNEKQYMLWIDDMSRSESITVLSHELIHLKQYNESKLLITNSYIIWNDNIYTYDEVNSTDYFKREWELEAFKKSFELEAHLRSILLKK